MAYMGAALLVLLAGCSASGLATAYKLRNVDPFATPSDALRVAVDVPDTVALQRNVVRMIGTVDYDDGGKMQQGFHLVSAPDDLDAKALRGDLKPGRALHVFQIKPSDRVEFDSFRAAAQQTKTDARSGSGSLSVETPVCTRNGKIPNPVRVSVWLKVAEVPGFVPLVKNEDLDADAHVTDVISACR